MTSQCTRSTHNLVSAPGGPSKEEKRCPSHLLPIKYDGSTYKLSAILPSSSKTELTDDMIVSTAGKDHDTAPASSSSL
jgi:hypothetical protein